MSRARRPVTASNRSSVCVEEGAVGPSVADVTREFDVVLFGATGFTGTLTAEYLARQTGTRWAMAGRNADKLAALRDRLGVDVPILVADSTDAPACAGWQSAPGLWPARSGRTSCMASRWWPPAPRPAPTMST